MTYEKLNKRCLENRELSRLPRQPSDPTIGLGNHCAAGFKERNSVFVMLKSLKTICLSAIFFFITGSVLLRADELNVALIQWGATATASSEFTDNCRADKVLNGKWRTRDTDKWTSAHDKTPHWVRIDLGDTYEINKTVIRHEGACGEGREFNTSDYRLQRSDSPDGPWVDLVEPVRGNTDDVTSHTFTPVQTRYVRLFIEKAEQNSNQCARIFSVEIYMPTLHAKKCLFGLDFPDRTFRKKAGRLEVLAQGRLVLPDGISVESGRIVLEFAGTQMEVVDDKPQVWLPATGEPLDVVLLEKTEDGASELARTKVMTPLPNYFSDGGTVYIMSSSHQDIAWMDSPQFCRKWRDQYNVTPALELMKTKKDYRFTVECMMYLMDELEDHPERREQVHQYTKEGLLEWGATYTQPYESMLSGEQMVRGMYLGRKWLHATFPDCDARVAWSPDVPGRAMQMPQILSKAGIPYLMFSRHEPGLYNWESPDGSGIIAYTPGHYCESGRAIFMVDAEEGASEVHRRLASDSDYFRTHRISPNYPLLRSWDFSPATDLSDLINAVSSKEKFVTEEDHTMAAAELKVRYSSSREFFESVKDSKSSLKTIVGERPNPWLYIHGPGHHWAVSASREAGILLPAAETFSTIQCILDGSFDSYPTREFFESWKAACFPDHGWGGNKGDITDALFKEKLEYARDKGQQLLDRSLDGIASHVKTDTAKGRPLIVFNTLSWQRSGVVKADVSDLAGEIHVTDSSGYVVPHQRLSANEDKKNNILFIAEGVPSTGYKTYYVVPGRKDAAITGKTSVSDDVCENKFYKLTLAEGGVRSIYDKQLKQEILRPDKFLGGEVFTMQSVGNGAGEFADVQQPSMEGFDKVSSHHPAWTLNESQTGPVQTVFNVKQKLKHGTVQQTLTLYNGIKKIDFEVSLLGWDGTQSREFRMSLPVNIDDAKVSYEVAMGVLEVGKDEIEGAAGERYTTPCKDVHPREVMNFMTAANQDFGVTMSSCVAVFDWIDPTTDPVSYPVLQPILLASRKSCHWEGPWYLQAGDHHYQFSVLSHQSDWKSGYRFGVESNMPLQIVSGVKPDLKATLPEEKSFFSVSEDNVVVSTIKKCEDDNNVIVRLYDVEGKDSESALNTFFSMDAAEHTNIIEEEGKSIPVSGKSLKMKIGHHAIETFKLIPDEMK